MDHAIYPSLVGIAGAAAGYAFSFSLGPFAGPLIGIPAMWAYGLGCGIYEGTTKSTPPGAGLTADISDTVREFGYATIGGSLLGAGLTTGLTLVALLNNPATYAVASAVVATYSAAALAYSSALTFLVLAGAGGVVGAGLAFLGIAGYASLKYASKYITKAARTVAQGVKSLFRRPANTLAPHPAPHAAHSH
ncbi:hypothetical protein COY95_00480 [Candidatus Woesearchaeota archaeon CG_4_10_14_0_8_um_filter_47_5]|nr:MAG: hypothetical protein COY95_00480 [Candidatus Woesearchaeota archaeon CG_4_10_14_0_8_um_filter_47_5]